jgi:Uma2 family endonuclease
MADAARALPEHYTYRNYKEWPDDERWELIDGVAYAMSPAPSRKHQDIVVELLRQFSNFLLNKPCRVYVAPFDLLLPEVDETDDEIDTVVQPDLLVICNRTILTSAGARGVPDLIVEILSPSTARKDTREKFLLYERIGVREYWIVDHVAATVTVFLLGVDGRYGRPNIYGVEETINVTVLEGLEIVLESVFRED